MKVRTSLLLGVAVGAFAGTGAFACNVTVTANSASSDDPGCQFELQSGVLTVDDTVGSSGLVYGIEALGTDAASGIAITSIGAVQETATVISNSAAIAVGDGTNAATLGFIDNYGTLSDPNYQIRNQIITVKANATLLSFTNHVGGLVEVGTLGGRGGSAIEVDGTLGTFTNNGLMQSESNIIIIDEGATLTSFFNSATGVMKTTYTGVVIDHYGTMTDFTNAGLIDSVDYYGLVVNDGSTIGSIVNTGSITFNGDQYGAMIVNFDGSIGSLDNFQGENGSGDAKLTYGGILPNQYNVIISGAEYGQLLVQKDAANLRSSQLTFGVSTLSGKVTQLSYAGVIEGLSSTQIASLSGTAEYSTGKTVDWILEETGDGTEIWNLVFSTLPIYGPDGALTREQLVSLAQDTSSLLAWRNAALTSLLARDCDAFGENRFCVGVTANQSIGAYSEGTGFNLNAAAKLTDTLRLGVFYGEGESGATSQGLKVTDGGIQAGVFLGYGSSDGVGVQARAAAGWQSGTVEQYRFGDDSTESAFGAADVGSQGSEVKIGYGFAQANGWVITPFGGLREVESHRDAFSEETSVSTEYPIAYDKFLVGETVAFTGVKASGRIGQDISVNAAAGVDVVVNQRLSSFGMAADIDDLGGAIGLDQGKSTLWNASFGIGYQIDANTSATFGFSARQTADGDAHRTAYVGIQVGF